MMPLHCMASAPVKWSLGLVCSLLLLVRMCPHAHAKVRLGLETQVEYNDNLFLEESDETRDVMYRVSPWIALERQWPRVLATARYQPRYTWYDKHPEYDLEGHTVGLGLSGDLAPSFNMALESAFVRGEERDLDQFNPEQATRRPYSSYASSLAGTWATGRDESYGFLVFGETLDFDKESTSLDSTEVGGEVTGRQRVGDLDFVTLKAGHIEGKYDDSTSYRLSQGTLGAEHGLNATKRVFARLGVSYLAGDARANYTIWNPLVGMAGEVKRAQYDIGAGVLIYDQKGEDTTYAPSLVATVTSVKRWPRGEVTASFTSGYDEEYLDSGNPGFDTYASAVLGVRYAMAKAWVCDSSCGLRGDYYRDNRPGEINRYEGTLRLAAGLEHQLARRAILRLDYRFNARRSEISRYGYDENRILLTLNLFTEPTLIDPVNQEE